MESRLDLKAIVSEHILAGRAEAATIVMKNADKNHVREQAWDLVPAVCEFVSREQNDAAPEVITACEEILLHLTSVANVKELLLVLLEQAETFNDDVRFKVLLPPLQNCLLKLPGNKAHSVGITLETLYSHVKSLPLPEDQQLEGRERILLDLDENVKRCTEVTYAFLKFLEPIVAQVAWKKGSQETREKNRRYITDLTKYLLKVLSHPVAYLDLTYREQDDTDSKPPPKSRSRVCAEKAMVMLCDLQGNLPHTILALIEANELTEIKQRKNDRQRKEAEEKGEDVDDDLYSVEELVPVLGLATCCYLVFGESLSGDSVPQVYSEQYKLELNCHFITHLLNQKENLLIYKGLVLLSALQEPVMDKSFTGLILEAGEVKDLIYVLIKVMTSAKVKELSQTAVSLLKCLLKKFDIPGRNQFLFLLLNEVKHSGLFGYVITLLKDEIDENLKLSHPDMSFVGSRLWRLLKPVFILRAGDRTDLLENVDWIMAALNILRYLVIRDKPAHNITGIWNHIVHIQHHYCEVLHKGINLSRAHYELELRNSKQKPDGLGPEMAFDIGGESISGMDRDQEIHALGMALHTFDMMESLVGRVNELVDQQRNDSDSK